MDTDGVLVRCNEDYQQVWLNQSTTETYTDLVECEGNEFVVVGFGRDGIIKKYKKNDENDYQLQWERNVGTELKSVIRKENGNFVIAGSTSSSTTIGNIPISGGSGIIVEYDTQGNVINAIEVQGENKKYNYECTGIIQTLDGGFLVGGTSEYDKCGFIKKYDRNYRIMWEREAEGSGACAVTETADNMHYVMGGYFRGEIHVDGETYTSKGNRNAIIIQYDKNGKVEWVKTYGGSNSLVNYITSTKNNNLIAVIKMDGTDLEIEGEKITTDGVDGAIIEYNTEGKAVDKTFFQGTRNNYGTVIKEMPNGRFLVGVYNNGEITLENEKTYNSNGIVIEVGENVIQPEVKNTKEVTFINYREEYDIYTKVEGTGGSISGYTEGEEVIYESVLHQEDSKKDIVVTPQIGYQVSKITINGEEILFKKETDGKVLLEKFENMSEDKHIVVTFTANPAEIIVHHYIDGTNTRVPLADGTSIADEVIYGEIGKTYETQPKENLEKYQLVSAKLPANANGTMTSESEEVIYYYELKEAEVIVHHYKDGTEESLAEDEIIKGKIDDHYQTNAKTDISEYRVVETKLPTNANGTMTEEKIEVTYYYELKEAEIIVHHYKDGTEEALAEDETIRGKIGDHYQTNAKTDISGYRVVETKLPTNANGTMTSESEEVIYYYELKEAEVIVHHYKDGTEESLAEDEIIKGKIEDHYQTNAKTDISGYRVVETKLPTNANGTMIEEKIEVIYYYSPIPRGTVTVHHYIEDSTELLLLPDGSTVPDEIIEGQEGEQYTTQPKEDLEKYELVESKLPANASGAITEEPIEVIYYYRVKTVKITTEVEGIGGTISGQGQNPYETVEYGEDSIKDLIIIPDKYYRVSKITINGQEIEFIEDMYKEVYLNTFNQMKEDKHIIVSFEKMIAGKVTVKYLEYGTNKELVPNEQKEGNVGDAYTTQRKDIEGYIAAGIDPINANGVLTEEAQEVIYYYMRASGTVTVKYIDIDTGEEIAQQEMKSDYVGEEYTTVDLIKEIEKYTFVGAAENENGTYIEGNIEVIYYYRKIPAKVIVQYLEKGTNQILTKEEVVNGEEGDPYDVTDLEKDIKGYNKVEEKPENRTGEMTQEDIIVVYYYERKQANITENEIAKEGTSKLAIPVGNQKVSYTINYHAQVTDYMGNAIVTIIDYLPYEIDGESSKIAGGIYNQAQKTITWEETIENIDTYENGNKEIVITKQIEVVYKNIDFSKDGFVNRAKGKITLDTTNQEIETEEVQKETKFDKPEIELVTKVEKTGDKKITNTETPIYYEVNYTATVDHFIGKAVIRFVDQLPYAINEEKSDLSNFGTKTTMEELGPGKYVYNAEDKTIIWEEVVEDINTFQALEAKVLNKTKSFSVQYIYDNNGETLSGILSNTVKAVTNLVEIEDLTEENPQEKIVKTEEKQDNHEVVVEVPTKVTVHHYIYDSEKEQYTSIKVPSITSGEVVQDEEKVGIVGEKYTTTKSNQVAKNYEIVSETPEKHEGTMTKTPIEVIYYYKLKEETVNSEINKTAKADKTIEREGENVEVLMTEGGAITYNISYKVMIENYIGKAKVTIVDTLPAKINLENADLKGGHYNRLNNTITWEEEITGIDTFTANRAFEKTITKQIELIYEGQNKVEPITNKVTGTIKTYYPDNYPEDPENPTKEKQTQTKEETETVEQEYKVSKTVQKVWEDNNNAKGRRPESVKVQLTANNQTIWEDENLENAILSEANHWSYTFEDLPKYDRFGNEINYSVEESEVNAGELEYYEIPQITCIDGQDKIIVTNNYRLVNTELESKIEKTGTDKITSVNQEVNYHIHYQANIKDYIGEVIVTITDTLPYPIDETKSNLAGGTYHEDTKTIIWTRNLGHINANVEEVYPVSIEKDITIYYKNIDTTEEKMTNNIKGKIEFIENETKNEVIDNHETLIDIKGRIITKYIEKATGKEIADRKDEAGKVGLEYSAYPKTIYGYTFLEDSGNTVGKVIEGTIEIIFYYEKKDAGNVVVKYVDEEGNELIPQETIGGKVGDPYKAKEKQIEEYELEKVTGDPPEGVLDENSKEVVYHYKKCPGKIIIRYLEKETQRPLALEEIKEGKVGDAYETARKVIEGYQKAEPEPENASGTMTKEPIIVIYYYEKIPSGKITVKYIEYETKQEITYQDENNEKKPYTYEISGYVGEKYETSEKEILYYEYLRNLEPSNKTGIYKQDDDTVIYYYRKLSFNMGVEKKIKEATVNGKAYNIGKNEKLTKIEVVASELANTKVEIKYAIIISNTEEIDGTVKVVDKVPTGFKVANSNPNYWKVQEDGSLITTVDLKKKETKELEVVLKWKNENSNLGAMNNKVEIVETANPANYLETTVKDNTSEATVVMSIKTGKQRQVLVTALGTIASTGLLVLLYQYQRYQKERERAIRHVVLEGKNVVIKKQKQK